MIELLLTIGFVMLLIAAIHDFKTKEVPDWLNYAGIASGLGIRAIWSLTDLQYQHFLYGLIGFTIFFALGAAMYYLGQWGGGDAKAMMALGAILGFEARSDGLLASFLANLLILGGAYGIVWVLYLAVKHKHQFLKELEKLWKQREYRLARTISYAVAVLLLIGAFIIPDYTMKLAFLVLLAAVIITGNLVTVVKAVEVCCMFTWVAPHKLTEGDWIANDVKYKNRLLASPKDLGVTKKQIALLTTLERKGKIRRVLIKEGIPFLPSFLLAYTAMVLWGNLFLKLLLWP